MRDKNIDILKGIGIFLVFLGHNPELDRDLNSYIFSFHMPLFFFISGVLFTQKGNFKEFSIRKFNGTIIPYFCIWIFSYLIHGIDLLIRGKFKFESYINYFADNVLFALSYKATGLWFLPVLFFVSLVFYWVHRFCKDKTWAYIIVLTFIGLSGQILQFLDVGKTPLRISTIPVAVLIFGVGYLLRNIIVKIKPNAFIFVILFIVGFKFHDINGRISMASNQYHNILYFMLSATASILFFLLVAKIIKSNKLLEFIGANSLIFFTLCDGMLKRYLLTPLSEHGLFFSGEGTIGAIIWAVTQALIGIPIALLINNYFPFIVGKGSNGNLRNLFKSIMVRRVINK